jgi:hypothetical protein
VESSVHFALKVKGVGFGEFESDDGTKVESGYLAIQFGAAEGSGNHDDLVLQLIADGRFFEIDRVAAEEIVDRDITDLRSEAAGFYEVPCEVHRVRLRNVGNGST